MCVCMCVCVCVCVCVRVCWRQKIVGSGRRGGESDSVRVMRACMAGTNRWMERAAPRLCEPDVCQWRVDALVVEHRSTIAALGTVVRPALPLRAFVMECVCVCACVCMCACVYVCVC